MTICIAALYNDGKGCALTSDLMTTAHIPIGYEFESDDIAKIIKLNESTCILTAGDVLFANEVVVGARRKLEDVGEAVSVSQIAENVRMAYQEVRRNHIIRNELESRALDINFYYENQHKLVAPIIQMIDEQFRTWNPGVELIVAGKDSSGCHIYTIQNPGDVFCHDPVGFVAIGSGAPHALYSLIESKYKKMMAKGEVEELVEKAKKRSEVAPGVGIGTESISI